MPLHTKSKHADIIAQACRQIETSDTAPNLDKLAKSAGMSRFHFHRLFKNVTGVTPKAYASAHRTNRIKKTLSQNDTVTRAIYDAGFNSNSRFYESSNKLLGMTPTAFRKGGSNTTIKFAIGECSLGAILVAATDKGVCAIFLGDDPDELARELQDRFPKAEIVGGDKKFEKMVARVVGFVENPERIFDLPLDIQGTAFQQKVWQALMKIPAGSTASYSDIARRLKTPNAVRAVASACARNRIAVAIPCHRVVRNDGALSGYRWGVERKQKLLEREGSVK